MTLTSHVPVCCVLLSLAVGASCSTPAEREIPRRPLKAHSFDHEPLQPHADSLEEQPSASFAQSEVASPDVDVSCIPRGDNTGSQTEELRTIFEVDSTEQCFAACRADRQCSHFTYSTRFRRCFLKSAAPKFYTYRGDETGPASCDASCYIRDIMYHTPAIQEYIWQNRRPQDCQAACYGTEECQAFVWLTGKCLLYGPGFSAYKGKAEGALAGPKGFCDRGGNLTLQELQDGGGGERCLKGPHIGSDSTTIKRVQASLTAECIEACEKNQDCTHFTYKPSTRVCLLKEGEPVYENSRGSITGAPTCDVEFMGEEFENAQETRN